MLSLTVNFPCCMPSHSTRVSARIEEHNHPFSLPERCIIRRAHANAPDPTSSDPERHHLPGVPASARSTASVTSVWIAVCWAFQALACWITVPTDNRIRLPGEVFHREFEHRRMACAHPRTRTRLHQAMSTLREGHARHARGVAPHRPCCFALVCLLRVHCRSWLRDRRRHAGRTWRTRVRSAIRSCGNSYPNPGSRCNTATQEWCILSDRQEQRQILRGPSMGDNLCDWQEKWH